MSQYWMNFLQGWTCGCAEFHLLFLRYDCQVCFLILTQFTIYCFFEPLFNYSMSFILTIDKKIKFGGKSNRVLFFCHSWLGSCLCDAGNIYQGKEINIEILPYQAFAVEDGGLGEIVSLGRRDVFPRAPQPLPESGLFFFCFKVFTKKIMITLFIKRLFNKRKVR